MESENLTEVKQSPSEVCMEALEDFSRAEPTHVLIVYLNSANEIIIKSNSMDYVMVAGIGSYLQARANHRMLAD
ncbi:MAG TPA: hypothetical protein VGF75_08290 [Candidatus Saccharimonadales bacterium]|jgi:hypothetical protein